MVAIVLEEVDFDDPTTNVRGRRALAITKPISRGYRRCWKHNQPDHEGLFLQAIEERAGRYTCFTEQCAKQIPIRIQVRD